MQIYCHILLVGIFQIQDEKYRDSFLRNYCNKPESVYDPSLETAAPVYDFASNYQYEPDYDSEMRSRYRRSGSNFGYKPRSGFENNAASLYTRCRKRIEHFERKTARLRVSFWQLLLTYMFVSDS